MATLDAHGNYHDENNGRFTSKDDSSSPTYADAVNERIAEADRLGIPVPLNANGSVDDLKLQELIGNKKHNKPSISREEKARWFSAIGEIKRGMWCPKIAGCHAIQIDNKIFFTEGTYDSPKLTKVLEFPSVEEADYYIERKYKKW